MTTRTRRKHTTDQRWCTTHQLQLDDSCWCGVIHGTVLVECAADCPGIPERWALWGFHPAYLGEDGYPYPLRLAVGTERDCNGEMTRRKKQGGWTMGRYRHGAPPTGLRLLCDEAYPNRSHLGER